MALKAATVKVGMSAFGDHGAVHVEHHRSAAVILAVESERHPVAAGLDRRAAATTWRSLP